MVVEVLIGGKGSGQTCHKCCGTTGCSTQRTFHTSALTAFAACVVGHNLDEAASVMCHDTKSGMHQQDILLKCHHNGDMELTWSSKSWSVHTGTTGAV